MLFVDALRVSLISLNLSTLSYPLKPFTKPPVRGLRPANSEFSFSNNVLESIQRTILPFDVGSNGGISPLTPLSDTPSPEEAFAGSTSQLSGFPVDPAEGRGQAIDDSLSAMDCQMPLRPDMESVMQSPRTPLWGHSLPIQGLGDAPSHFSQLAATLEEDHAEAVTRAFSSTPANAFAPYTTPVPLSSLKVSSSPIPSSLHSKSIPLVNATVPADPPTARTLKRRAREKELSKRNHKKKGPATKYAAGSKLAEKHFGSARPVQTPYSSQNIPISKSGFIGLRTGKKKSSFPLEHFVGPQAKENFTLRRWNGGAPMPLIDNDDMVVGVCAGIPKNAKDWDDLQRHAASLLENARSKLKFDKKDKDSRRGKFSALNVGISHGGGQPYPKALEQESVNAPILKELMEDPSFGRISGFAAGAFSTWAPRLYEYENTCLSQIIENDEKLRRENKHRSPDTEPLRRNWPNTPWASTALNFGPQTVCFKHADYGNLAFGWCCITALGDYDYTRGGHLILWDLKLVVEFPPGSTILIPSSAIHHSNTLVHPGERRYSVTQYSSGGLFRWRDNGYQTVEAHRSSMTPEEVASLLDKLSSQLEFGLSLYSTVGELEKLKSVRVNVE